MRARQEVGHEHHRLASTRTELTEILDVVPQTKSEKLNYKI